MKSKQQGRRRFLKDSAALAGLAVGAAGIAGAQTPGSANAHASPRDLHAYGERSRFETSHRIGNNGRFGNNAGDDPKPGQTRDDRDIGLRTPHQNSYSIITPAAVHYVISHGYEPRDINPREHRLMIHGMVDRPLVFTMDDLKRLPSVTRVHFVECRADGDPSYGSRRNPSATVQITHGFSSCSVWTGVPLSLLLKEAGVRQSASWILAEGVDRQMHTKSIPMVKVNEDVLVVYGQNGEALRPEQGYPLRLLVPGYEGINSVKWLHRIKVTDKPTMTRSETIQYPELRGDGKARWFQSVLGVNSVITRPSGGSRLPGRGYHQITGFAWSGRGAIRRVEVSTDGGRSWKDAQIQAPVYEKAFTQFEFPWTWNGDEALLQSRSTDDHDEVQPTMAEIGKIWNLPASYFNPAPFLFGHFNAIQPWKVSPDGSVQNALFT